MFLGSDRYLPSADLVSSTNAAKSFSAWSWICEMYSDNDNVTEAYPNISSKPRFRIINKRSRFQYKKKTRTQNTKAEFPRRFSQTVSSTVFWSKPATSIGLTKIPQIPNSGPFLGYGRRKPVFWEKFPGESARFFS